ncbi:MAG TPA: hypothetical protein VFP68_08720 [Burkholderiaceae bacterium]|nr:hypothetical protein [Burkholderiaceae bacterium]
MQNPCSGTHRHSKSKLLYEYRCEYQVDQMKREVSYALTVKHGDNQVAAIQGAADFGSDEFFEDALVDAIEREIDRL